MSNVIDKVVGSMADKQQWRQYRSRVAALPAKYRAAVEGLERYMMRAGSQGYDASVQMWEDLVELFEQAASDGTPIRDIVGNDPVAFADAFSSNYGTTDWRSREKQRLQECIAQAEAQPADAT